MQRFFNRIFFISYLFFSLISCSVSKQISRQANRILINDTAIRTGHIGISIYEPATGKYWYNYNADKYFIPASNTKLFTLYAGMKYLGDSLMGLKYALINDTIYAFPTGDPTFNHPDFKEQPVSAFLSNNQLPCIFSNANWRAKKYGAGWAWDDHNESYMPERSALPINGNVSEQKIPFGTNGITTALGILHNKYPLITATPLEFKIQPLTFKIIKTRPSDSLFKPMMQTSDNFFAEQTLLMASNEYLAYMSDEKMIDTLLKSDLKAVPQMPQWVDGSGLSRYNLFTPQAFIYILEKMKNEFGMERLKTILPTGGEGSLKHYYIKDSSYFFAKTGTLNNVCALSGFLYTERGKILIFSILVNNYQTGPTPVRKAIEHFLEAIRKNF